MPDLNSKDLSGLPVEKALQVALEQVETNLSGYIETQKAELKTFQKTTDDTASKMQRLESAYEQIQQDIKGQLTEAMGGEFKEMVTKMQGRIDELEAASKRPNMGGGEEIKTFGQRITESEQFSDWVGKGARGWSNPIEMKSLFPSQKKAFTGTSISDARNILSVRVLEAISVEPGEDMRVRDLFRVIPTSQAVFEHVRETGFVPFPGRANPANAAATVAEGALKPESALTLTDHSVTASTIAHWTTVTRQALRDIPALQAMVEERLVTGLKLEEDNQILYGSGAGADLPGILLDADIQTYTQATVAGDTALDAIRRSMTLSQRANYPVTGMVMHPIDFEEIELLKGSQNHYIFNSLPEAGGVGPTLWRAPVAVTTGINENDCLIGGFNRGAFLLDLEEANVRMSDSHDDFFVRNQVVVLAEERLILALTRPESFVYCRFTPTS